MNENIPNKNKPNHCEIEKEKIGKRCPIKFVFNGDKLEKMIIDEENNNLNSLKRVFGTIDLELISEILECGANVFMDAPREQKFNTMVQALADFKPQNAMEARLCAQAQALYSQGMRLMACANDEKMMLQQEHCLKNAIKLLRLHNETVLALDKLRRGGEQKVVVQHVNVSDGGQAAIMAGNFQAGGGGDGKKEE